MNQTIKRGMVWIALLCGCAAARSQQCPGNGVMLSDTDARYCMYQGIDQAVVIEGGFECPAPMSFRLDLEASVICSDHAVDRAHLPDAVCTAIDGACPAHTPPPARPNEPSSQSSGPWIADAGLEETPSSPSGDPGVWKGCDPTDPTKGVLANGMTGDVCLEDGGPFGCGTSERCGGLFAMCDPGELLKLGTLDILDCSAADGYAGLGDDVQWQGAQACEQALDSGVSGQTCSGAFVCARATNDPCCVEYALCNQDPSLPTSLLVRYRQCERGCTQVTPDDSAAPVTSCADLIADPVQLNTANRPCEGDLICWNDQDLGSGTVTELQPQDTLRWCGAGVVRGQHSILGNVYIPNPVPNFSPFPMTGPSP